MTAEVGRSPVTMPRPKVSGWSRFYGFGSIYAKTMRDSRLAFLIMSGMLGGLLFVVSAAVGSGLGTAESRKEMARLATDLPPIIAGLAGKAVNLETLGGYLTWKYGTFFSIIAGLWSILALSGTLATEAQRGSLDIVATTPFGKRRIALEKLAAHLTMMAASMVVLAVACNLAGAAFGTLPNDAIPVQAAIGYALLVGLIGLASGSVAFALAPFLGRAAAAGIAGSVMFAGFILSGYQASVPAFSGIAKLSWFAWTADHLPLAGQDDWPSLIPVALVAAVLFAVGVEAFVRRDIGATSAVRLPGLPKSLLGLHGPVGRAFGERLPVSLAWGTGIGIFGLVVAAASRGFADEVTSSSPSLAALFRSIFPAFDITTAGGFLQLVFAEFGFILIGFAASTLISGWASDETSGRLEMLIATPLARQSWAVRSGIGVYLVIVVITAISAVAIGIGAVVAGSDAVTPMLGTVTLGLYTAALAGVGFAVGGLVRPTIAAETVAMVVIATFLVDLLAPAFKAPDWIHQLALTAHMGQAMVGIWDPVGVVLCLGLAIGGVLLGGLGISRRDLAD